MDIEKLKQYGLDENNMPGHVAIIMDGNGRWAKKRHMPRTYGHRKGVEKVREILKASSSFGVKDLSIFAFSTENWKRPKDEVDTLMTLLVTYLRNEVRELDENNVRLRIIGDKEGLSPVLQAAIADAEDALKDNDGINFNVAVNYGSRQEILKAAFDLANDHKEKGTELTEEEFRKRMYNADMPDVDLLIRTSGELRISNFLLYQIAYAELEFVDVYWPDFDIGEYAKALNEYQNRNRRYVGLRDAKTYNFRNSCDTAVCSTSHTQGNIPEGRHSAYGAYMPV